MQLSSIFTLLAVAMTATALPAADNNGAVAPRTDTSTCNSDQKFVCCNGILGCAVSILGTGCGGQSYCCTTNSGVGTLINISVLNCNKIL